jgi:hypothetical protein
MALFMHISELSDEQCKMCICGHFYCFSRNEKKSLIIPYRLREFKPKKFPSSGTTDECKQRKKK